MKILYEIDRESLIELSKKIYEEACLGYMDLKESVWENLIEEFLKDKNSKKIEEATNVNTVAWTYSMTANASGNWDGGIGVPGTSLPNTQLLNESSIPQVTNHGPNPASDVAGVVITSTTFDTEVSLRNTDQDMLSGL